MADVEVELTPGQTINLGVNTPSVSLGVDLPSITLDVHAVVGGGGGGGASALADLTDVDLTPPPYDNQVLSYDVASSTWLPEYPSLLFITYTFASDWDTFASYGIRVADLLPTAGLDGLWWFRGEATYPADRGVWMTTDSGATVEQLSPQPAGVGMTLFNYLDWNGAGFSPANLLWLNTTGGDAADVAAWTPMPTQAANVQHTKAVPADWDGSGSQTADELLDELAARVRILEP